jgi:hypothetical protein
MVFPALPVLRRRTTKRPKAKMRNQSPSRSGTVWKRDCIGAV